MGQALWKESLKEEKGYAWDFRCKLVMRRMLA